MSVYSTLLSTVPIPQQQWQTKVDTPPVASVKVGDVVRNDNVEDTAKQSSKNFFLRFIEDFKNKMIQRRIKKLENIPPEQRTPVQQAEIDANNKEKTQKIYC